MARRPNLGTQPQATTVPQRGRGGGGLINRRGGGGGNNRNRNRIPNTGLWAGRAGQALANQQPEQFFRGAVSNLGGLDYSGTPLSEFSDEYVARLMDQYNAALATNQRLSPRDWMRNTYGAGYGGKRGNAFDAGSMGMGGDLGAAYRNYYSNTSPLDFLVGEGVARGGLAPRGGNAEFQRFYQDTFAPGVLAEQAGARAANPSISMADLIAGRDLMGEARRQFLTRPNAARQIGPANLASRWSWWE